MGETDTPTKTSKPSSTQEQPPTSSTASVYSDWAAAFQAYYNSGGSTPIPPPGYFHSPVASTPQGHPYIWGQHIIPPYGTPPPPYVAMYPHGGLYAHPSMPPGTHPYSPYAMPSPNGTADASVAVSAGAEIEGKINEVEKASGASANGVFSQSGESGSEGSSEGSDANSQNGSQQKQCCEQGSVDAEETQNGLTTCNAHNGVTRAPPTQALLNQTMGIMGIPPSGVAGPTTNLNIGMDYWGGPAPSHITNIRGKLPAVPTTGAIVPSNLIGSRDGIPSELWLQDERELKRQRRKQSNRESARRSRLRKQAECEELAQRVEALKEENSSLRAELGRIRDECDTLASENASLSERLKNDQGEDSRSNDGHDPLDCDSHSPSKMETVERDS